MGFFSENGGYEDPLPSIWQGAKLGYTLGIRMGTVAGWILGQLICFLVIALAAMIFVAVKIVRAFLERRKK